MHPAFLLAACLPLLFRILPWIVPAAYLEPYTYWSSASLNRVSDQDATTTRWRNMGWWEETDIYSDAAAALAKKLLDFAQVPSGGAVLDVAHGAGDSLALHLSAKIPPFHLHGITSLAVETQLARDLIATKFPNTSTLVELQTMSASYRVGKDFQHPMNPMRGYLGERKTATDLEWEDDNELEPPTSDQSSGPPPYDLIYVLDAIYHFPPSVPYFLASALQALKPGSGVVAFTDILPPPGLSNLLGHLVLPPLLSVPARNFVQRPKSLEEYKALMERIEYEEVSIEDWSDGVWNGFAGNLASRGIGWRILARVIRRAERTGWKFVAVRGKRPAQAHPHPSDD